MKKKTIPLPCDEQQYKTIKMYCLVHGLKYADLTKKLLNIIKEEENGTRNTTV